jgi:hypothetical protein
MFAAEYEPAQASRRLAVRAPVSLDATYGRGLDRALCRVTDVSAQGAKLQTYSALKPGSIIWLVLPAIGPRLAEVRWSDDFRAGCRFRRPLRPAEFQVLLSLG